MPVLRVNDYMVSGRFLRLQDAPSDIMHGIGPFMLQGHIIRGQVFCLNKEKKGARGTVSEQK